MTGVELHNQLKEVEEQKSKLPSTNNHTPEIVLKAVRAVSEKLWNESDALWARLGTLRVDGVDRTGRDLRRDWELIGKELDCLPGYLSPEAHPSIKKAFFDVRNGVAKRQAAVERRLALLKEDVMTTAEQNREERLAKKPRDA